MRRVAVDLLGEKVDGNGDVGENGRERKRTRIRKSKRLNVGIQWNAKRSRKRLNFNMEVAFIAPTRFWLRTLKRVREDSFKVFVWKRIVSMGATRMQLHFGKLTAYSL